MRAITFFPLPIFMAITQARKTDEWITMNSCTMSEPDRCTHREPYKDGNSHVVRQAKAMSKSGTALMTEDTTVCMAERLLFATIASHERDNRSSGIINPDVAQNTDHGRRIC